MKKSTLCVMAACGAMTAMTQAEPTLHVNSGLSFRMGTFLYITPQASEYAPLDITKPAADQLDIGVYGPIPGNHIALILRAQMTSSGIGWRGVGTSSIDTDDFWWVVKHELYITMRFRIPKLIL